MSSALAANPMIQKFIGEKAETFDSESAAIDAFKSRLIAKDVPGLSKLLGLNAEAAAKSDDFAQRLDELAKAAGARLTIVDRDACRRSRRREVVVGRYQHRLFGRFSRRCGSG